MAQKEYHNYPIGTIIYPRDNSFQKLISTKDYWDGIDHSNDLYLKSCKVCSAEYMYTPSAWYFKGKEYPVVNVEYKGGIYRVSISEFWNLTTGPSLIDELDDFSECDFI